MYYVCITVRARAIECLVIGKILIAPPLHNLYKILTSSRQFDFTNYDTILQN